MSAGCVCAHPLAHPLTSANLAAVLAEMDLSARKLLLNLGMIKRHSHCPQSGDGDASMVCCRFPLTHTPSELSGYP